MFFYKHFITKKQKQKKKYNPNHQKLIRVDVFDEAFAKQTSVFLINIKHNE